MVMGNKDDVLRNVFDSMLKNVEDDRLARMQDLLSGNRKAIEENIQNSYRDRGFMPSDNTAVPLGGTGAPGYTGNAISLGGFDKWKEGQERGKGVISVPGKDLEADKKLLENKHFKDVNYLEQKASKINSKDQNLRPHPESSKEGEVTEVYKDSNRRQLMSNVYSSLAADLFGLEDNALGSSLGNLILSRYVGSEDPEIF